MKKSLNSSFLNLNIKGHCDYKINSSNQTTDLFFQFLISSNPLTWDLLKEVAIIFITSTIVWPQVNSREGTQLHPSTENWIKDLLSMALPIRPSVPPVSLSHQEVSISLLSIREWTERKPQSQKTYQTD